MTRLPLRKTKDGRREKINEQRGGNRSDMMYLHIGNGNNIRKSSIVGIFDLDMATVSVRTRRFIAAREKAGEINYNDEDLPRSFLLCEESRRIRPAHEKNEKKGKHIRRGRKEDETLRVRRESTVRIELSRISPAALCQRAEGDLYDG